MLGRFRHQPIGGEAVLQDFTANYSDFQMFLPPTSELFILGAGTATIKAGLYAVAAERRSPGVEVVYATRTPDQETANDYRTAYPRTMEPLQEIGPGQPSEWSYTIAYEAGRKLLSEQRKVLGAFVLFEAQKPRKPSGEVTPYLAAFVSNALIDSVRDALRRLVEPEEGETISLLNQKRLQDRAAQTKYAIHLLAGLFPEPQEVNKTIAVRR